MKKKNNRLANRYRANYVNTSRGVDQNRVQAYDLLNNRSRVRSTKGSRGETEPVLENTFKREVPQTLSRQMYYGLHPDQNKPVEYLDEHAWTGEVRRHIHVERPEEAQLREDYSNNKVWLPTPKRAAEVRAKEIEPKTLYTTWMSERHQRVVSYHELVLEKREGFVLKMLFQGPEWMLIQEVGTRRFISRVYPNRQEAYRAYGNGKISWIMEEKI